MNRFVERYFKYMEDPESLKEEMDEMSGIAQMYRRYLAEHPDLD